ncbi:hypothetical protein HMPREF1039_1504 [Megasphaera lornae]|uniref:Uncharacterized protein n=1 Tax=Megasphaera lornae TaxID=1000568 RepID=A0ABN0CYK6_9FIRM|nr:hypothetical protein HMPREF1039_1504 [Megasphaera lornae]
MPFLPVTMSGGRPDRNTIWRTGEGVGREVFLILAGAY